MLLPDKVVSAAAAEYSTEEREILLALVHRAIEARLKQETIDTTPPTPHLAELRGAFTTLYLRGRLRGCVGYVRPSIPCIRRWPRRPLRLPSVTHVFTP